jgi:hypothetical protein
MGGQAAGRMGEDSGKTRDGQVQVQVQGTFKRRQPYESIYRSPLDDVGLQACTYLVLTFKLFIQE